MISQFAFDKNKGHPVLLIVKCFLPSPDFSIALMTVKAAVDRLSTYILSIRYTARSLKLLNLTPNNFSTHSRMRNDAALLVSSS